MILKQNDRDGWSYHGEQEMKPVGQLVEPGQNHTQNRNQVLVAAVPARLTCDIDPGRTFFSSFMST